MKTAKTLFALMLALCMAVAFAACAPQTSEPADDTDESAETLIMATNAAFPPYEYYEGGEIVGIDPEIAGLIAEKLGMELKIEDMEFESILGAVSSGKADVGIAAITVDPDRLVSNDFSTPYATGKQVIIVQEGSDITDVDDLTGKKIGVQLNTTGDIYCTDDFGEEAMERYSKGADAVQALVQGKIDAVVIDNEPAKVFVSQNEGLKILETEYVEEEYAIAVAKGNSELLEKINAALAELEASGELKAVIDKYISAE